MPTKSNNTGGRGGRRPGAGRKKSPVREKYENGNPGGRDLTVLDIPDVEGEEMPTPHDFLSAKQHDGTTLEAGEIYRETWEWLDKIGVAKAVSPQLLERYAMCSARWIQCEDMTTRIPEQTSDDWEADPFSVHQYRHQLHESGKPPVERDLPDRKRELRYGIQRPQSTGRRDGEASKSQKGNVNEYTKIRTGTYR